MATHSALRIAIGSSVRSAVTASDMAMRWSSWLSTSAADGMPPNMRMASCSSSSSISMPSLPYSSRSTSPRSLSVVSQPADAVNGAHALRSCGKRHQCRKQIGAVLRVELESVQLAMRYRYAVLLHDDRCAGTFQRPAYGRVGLLRHIDMLRMTTSPAMAPAIIIMAAALQSHSMR